MIYITVLIRLLSIGIMIFHIVPKIWTAYYLEKNGLKRLRLFLLVLSVASTVSMVIPFTLQLCRMANFCSVYYVDVIDRVSFISSINSAITVILFYLIYNRKY